MPAPHFPSAGPIEQSFRKIYSGTMRRLGVSPYLTFAQGARFWIDPADFIDNTVALSGVWEAPQLESLANIALARKADCFLDIGANTGFYSVMFAVKKLTPRIIAFEPDPGNYARLMANVNANNLAERIECVQLALGDAASEVTLYEGAKHNRGESTIAVPEQTPQDVTFTVEQARFDDLYSLAGKNLIVKMDVEGHEFHVLDGMARTLRDNACYLQIEHYGERHEELKARLSELGYRYLYTEYIDLFFTNMPDV
ncbi:MAG TPA: FkbM family methyltransferase [Xanthobacteraceae bacterium]|nr:FkbM family methyltransferase [Xanthobacteraceae bacterium]